MVGTRIFGVSVWRGAGSMFANATLGGVCVYRIALSVAPCLEASHMHVSRLAYFIRHRFLVCTCRAKLDATPATSYLRIPCSVATQKMNIF